MLALKHAKCFEYKYFKGGKNDCFSVKGWHIIKKLENKPVI